MALPDLTMIVEKGLLLWLGAMAVIVVWRCITGQIDLSGMLADTAWDQEAGAPAPERVQMLLGFLFALAAYVREVVNQGAFAAPQTMLPEVSGKFIALFAASHSLYLGGKLGRHIFRNFRKQG